MITPELVAEHAGREALEVYGAPVRLREVEDEARGHGWPTRRTGTSVTILRAEDLDGELPEGEGLRRAGEPAHDDREARRHAETAVIESRACTHASCAARPRAGSIRRRAWRSPT